MCICDPKNDFICGLHLMVSANLAPQHPADAYERTGPLTVCPCCGKGPGEWCDPNKWSTLHTAACDECNTSEARSVWMPLFGHMKVSNERTKLIRDWMHARGVSERARLAKAAEANFDPIVLKYDPSRPLAGHEAEIARKLFETDERVLAKLRHVYDVTAIGTPADRCFDRAWSVETAIRAECEERAKRMVGE